MAQKFKNQIDAQEGIKITNELYDGSNAAGTSGQVLSSTGTGTQWIDSSADTAERIEVTVKNVSGGSLSKGTVVHAAPTATPPSGNVIEVVAADANVAANMPAIGVLNETIANEAEGAAVMFGAVSGIDTSSFTIGDELYVSTTAGEFTATKPTATTELVQKIAVVIKSHASNGLIKVFGAGRSNDVPNQIDRNVNFTDDSWLTFGDSTDLRIYHNSSNSSGNIWNTVGHLNIQNTSDDKDIVFLSDDGAGGNAEYFRLDGGGVLTYFSKPIQMSDNEKIFVGSGGDLQIYHDAANSYIETSTSSAGDLYIKAQGTNHDLYLQAVDDIFIRPQGGENGIVVTGNGAVKLYYDNSLKFETTSTGVNVTGGVTADNRVVIDGVDTGNPSASTNQLRVSGYGILGNRADIYITNENASGRINFGVGGVHSIATKMVIDSSGQIQFNDYGSGSFTGTATYRLAVDSSGDVIEIPIGDGAVDGSGTANTVTMWSDTDTITDAPITISGNNATFAGEVNATRFILPSTGTTTPANQYLFTNNTNTATGKLIIQSGGGSSGYGGAINLFSHSHSTKPGWVIAGISSGSGGKFSVNTQGLAGGTDVFTVDTSGDATFAGNITAGNNSNINLPTAASGNANLSFDGTDFKITSNSSSANLKLETNSTTRVTLDSSGNLTVGSTTTGPRLRTYYSDASYTDIYGYGIEFSRTSAYLRPVGNGTQNMYFGYHSGNLNWGNIYFDFYTSFNARYRGDNRIVANSTGISVYGSAIFNAPGTTNSILAEFRANNGNNAATFRTTDAGPIFRIHAQNNGDIYVQNDDGSRYLKIPNSGNNELYGDLLMPATGSKIILDAYATTQEGGGIFFREGFSSSNKYNLSIMARSRGNDGSADGLSINGYEGIAFSTGSNSYNERMYIDVNGKVRINNASASYQFNVNGTSGLYGEVYFYNAPSFHYHSASNTYLHIDTDTNYGLIDMQSGKELRINTSGGIVLIGTDTVAYSGTDLHIGNTTDTQNGIQITTSTSGYGYILFGDGYSGNESYKGQVSYHHGTDKMYFVTAGATRVEILSSGDAVFSYKVGVGISPTYDLDVSGTGAFGSSYRTYVSGTASGTTIEFGTDADNDSLGVLGCFASSFYFNTQQGLGYKFHYNSNLRMTINTGAETATLYATSTTGSNYLQFKNSAGTAQGYVGYGASANNHLFLVQQSASSDIILYNNGIYRVTVDSNGWTYFDNNNTGGGIEINGTGGKYLDIAVDSGYTSFVGNNKIYFNQNVGIYSTNPAYSLEVNGDMQADAITTTNTRVSTGEEYPIGHYTGGKEIWSLDTTWTDKQLQEYFGNSAVEWYEDSTAPGGYAIAITGGVYVGGAYDAGFPYIPVDANDIYYMEIYMRSWDGGGATTLSHYMGSIDYDHNFSSLGGNPGSYGYWTMSNTGTTNTWQKYQGIITGFGTSTGQFVSGTKYWTPQALFNYNHYSGTRKCVISGWRVTRINGQELFADGNANNPSISFAFDRDTGLFRQAANRISFAMGGSEEFRFYDNGELHCDNDVVAFSTTISDQRLKDNVSTIENALDKVKLLRGVEYDWNLGSKKGKHDLGVIAQEVEKVLPDIVTEKEMAFFDNGIYKTVDYEKLTAVLIESVKELSAKIERLENKNCNCK